MIIKKFIKYILKNNPQVIRIGYKNTIQYFIIQRVFRINSKVPWPVHWSSLVLSHQKIKFNHEVIYLGYMPGCYIQADNGIEIGCNSWVGPGVKIISSNHNINDYKKHDISPPIKIGDNCWLSSNCVILPGVELGNHVIVAAGAVVTKSFKGGNCVIAGVPARIVKETDDYSG